MLLLTSTSATLPIASSRAPLGATRLGQPKQSHTRHYHKRITQVTPQSHQAHPTSTPDARLPRRAHLSVPRGSGNRRERKDKRTGTQGQDGTNPNKTRPEAHPALAGTPRCHNMSQRRAGTARCNTPSSHRKQTAEFLNRAGTTWCRDPMSCGHRSVPRHDPLRAGTPSGAMLTLMGTARCHIWVGALRPLLAPAGARGSDLSLLHSKQKKTTLPSCLANGLGLLWRIHPLPTPRRPHELKAQHLELDLAIAPRRHCNSRPVRETTVSAAQ